MRYIVDVRRLDGYSACAPCVNVSHSSEKYRSRAHNRKKLPEHDRMRVQSLTVISQGWVDSNNAAGVGRGRATQFV
ncbi:hypothetical protein AG1IA_04344 [Rhizoctonia solani AG-1 IA]|uniref:Uncharacterized protein n=1 Tax=Thanatephorus cucumeris (strain AG1-IA) TaxID=983506 RepID=L8WZ27_THACA|nr:hypothetical protein AG1IA_04344 [Rhizoctonia solani AG-1 IA]